jgi:hypothetical protein
VLSLRAAMPAGSSIAYSCFAGPAICQSSTPALNCLPIRMLSWLESSPSHRIVVGHRGLGLQVARS